MAFAFFCCCSYAQIDASGNTTAIGLGATSTSSDYKFSYQANSIAHYGLGWYGDSDFSGGPMAYLSGYGGIKLFTAGIPRLNINNNGYVGIGTANPSGVLDIWRPASNGIVTRIGTNFDSGQALDIKAIQSSSGNGYYSFDASASVGGWQKIIIPVGNVGIGTTSPPYKLSVKSAYSALYLETTNSTTGLPLADFYDTGRSVETIISSTDETTSGTYMASYSNTPLMFGTNAVSSPTAKMIILPNGNVAIGSSDPKGYKLAVNGAIHTQEVKVDMTGWNDYVFDKTYPLKSLSLVKSYIDENHHLPEIPSEAEVIKNGVNIGEMLKLQIKKIEELTLYVIDKDKQLAEQNIKLSDQQQSIKSQQAQIDELKAQLKAIVKSLPQN